MLSKADVYEKAAPATLLIVLRGPEGVMGCGSGVVVTPDGLALTCFHVIDDVMATPERIECFVHPGHGRVSDNLDEFLRGFQGQAIGCRVVATLPQHDMAVIALDRKKGPFQHLVVGDSQRVRPGEDVIAIGNPAGLVWTMTAGTVSAVRENGIQTDAASSPGNSGGPLLNMSGEILGINSFGIGIGRSLNFARPVAFAKGILASAEHPWEGVSRTVQSRSRAVASATVSSDGPGARARTFRASLSLAPAETGGTTLIEGSRVALVLDATRRTYQEWWRTGEALRQVNAGVDRLIALGFPEVELYAVGLGGRSPRLGAVRRGVDAMSLLPTFPTVGAAYQVMTDERPLAAALDAMKPRPGDNLLVGALMRGPVSDPEAVGAWGRRELALVTPDEPFLRSLLVCDVADDDPGVVAALAEAPRVVPRLWRVERVGALADAFGLVVERARATLVCAGSGGRVRAEGGAAAVIDRTTGRSTSEGWSGELDVVPVDLHLELHVSGGAPVSGVAVHFENLAERLTEARVTW